MATGVMHNILVNINVVLRSILKAIINSIGKARENSIVKKDMKK